MILDGDKAATGATLDELFRRAGVRAPQALALSDPPNRASFTDGAPRQLTYAEADRAISALAARLRGLGLQTDAVVAMQLPNTVESAIALLGVLRAGMIAAPLPLLWRQQEIVAALRGTGAKAIVACARAGYAQPAKTAMLAAAELFPIRHVCAFGHDLPDGVVPLDEVFAPDASDFMHAPCGRGRRPRMSRSSPSKSPIPASCRSPAMPRNLSPAGAPFFWKPLSRSRPIFCRPIPSASFAGLALSVLPWLLSGGTLALHHGCDPNALEAQCEALSDAMLVVPGPALAPLAEAGRLLALKTIVALWRAPERLAACAPWYRAATLIDVAAFGETGLVAGKRCADGKPAPIPCGLMSAPRGAAGAITVLETARTRGGTVALRGPMVPARLFPAGEPLAPDGFIDTGFTCVVDGDALAVTGPPAGITTVGGYRFAQAPSMRWLPRPTRRRPSWRCRTACSAQRLGGAQRATRRRSSPRCRRAAPIRLIAGAFRRHLRVGAA